MHAPTVDSRDVVINYVGLAQAFPNYDYVQHSTIQVTCHVWSFSFLI